jgi:hypothetical protein
MQNKIQLVKMKALSFFLNTKKNDERTRPSNDSIKETISIFPPKYLNKAIKIFH